MQDWLARLGFALPPPVPGMPRPHHYGFAYGLLPIGLATAPDSDLEELLDSKRANAALAKLWDAVGALAGDGRVSGDGLRATHVTCDDGRVMLVVVLPRPQRSVEAYCVAATITPPRRKLLFFKTPAIVERVAYTIEYSGSDTRAVVGSYQTTNGKRIANHGQVELADPGPGAKLLESLGLQARAPALSLGAAVATNDVIAASVITKKAPSPRSGRTDDVIKGHVLRIAAIREDQYDTPVSLLASPARARFSVGTPKVLDDLALVELVGQLEEDFGVSIPDEAFGPPGFEPETVGPAAVHHTAHDLVDELTSIVERYRA
jgi:acyl carrier protein